MAKIYVLVAGEYSDFHIEGIYETREEAERYLKLFPLDEYADIEEWEIGTKPRTCLDKYIAAWYFEKYGNNEPICYEEGINSEALVGGIKFRVYSDTRAMFKKKHNFEYRCWVSKEIAPDKEHALKIFYDKIAEWKARQEGLAD